ncbi:NUDIX domain-containing protein [Candidatus Nomurabacteria bacterium]|nr:NUDIX domain-containing protein [Candidatus Nomurabacteria bacterium]
MSELIDILDNTGNLTGGVRNRDDVHGLGLWHKSIHVWIVNSSNEVLLQKRADWLRSNKGKWDLSVSGHVESGENVNDCVIREAKEEIGITLDPNEVWFLFQEKRQTTRNNNTYINNEFSDVFLVRKDIDNADLKNIGKEVEKVKWVHIDTLDKWLKEGKEDLVIYKDEYEKMFPHLEKTFTSYLTNLTEVFDSLK